MIRTYTVTVPFMGYDVVQVDVDDSSINDKNLDKACEDIALDTAKNILWDKLSRQIERFELFNLVEGTDDLSYQHFIDLTFKYQVEEITTIDERGKNK